MLYFFYGDRCGHCHNMFPLIEKLEKEGNAKLEKLEVWHNEKNREKLAQHDKGLCGGVPFFFNTKTNDAICGEAPYGALKEWANK